MLAIFSVEDVRKRAQDLLPLCISLFDDFSLYLFLQFPLSFLLSLLLFHSFLVLNFNFPLILLPFLLFILVYYLLELLIGLLDSLFPLFLLLQLQGSKLLAVWVHQKDFRIVVYSV